jgi:hypothetical protein
MATILVVDDDERPERAGPVLLGRNPVPPRETIWTTGTTWISIASSTQVLRRYRNVEVFAGGCGPHHGTECTCN